jgi:hypothetical protein
MKGICVRLKIIVNVIIPKTLKSTQNSVEKFRQIISLIIASNIKKYPQRFDKVSQA